MTAVKTAGAYPKNADTLMKKAAALWRWLNRTEEAPDGGFDDTYCMCRFLQTPLNRALDSALERITSPRTADTGSNADDSKAAAAKPRRKRQTPLRITTARPALEFDI